MQTFLKRFGSNFTIGFSTFVAGIIVSEIVDAVIGNVIPISMGLVAAASIIGTLFSAFIIISVHQRILSDISSSRIDVKTYHTSTHDNGDQNIYMPLIELITSARRSVRMITRYRSPTLDSSKARKDYFQQLERVLTEKEKRGENIIYERIVQVQDINPEGLSPDQTDAVTYKHCDYLLKLQPKSVRVSLRQIKMVLSTMDFFIIDDQKVVILIPAIRVKDSYELTPYRVGMGVFFHDPQGHLSQEMVNLLNHIHDESRPILRVLPKQN